MISVNKITTVADCDMILEKLNDRKANSDWETTTSNRFLDQNEANLDITPEQIQAITDEVTALDAELATMTPGTLEYTAKSRERSRKASERDDLVMKKLKRGVAVVIDTEAEVEIQSAIKTVVDGLIAQIETKKAELAA